MSDRDAKTEEEHQNIQDEANDDEVREGPFRISYPSSHDGGTLMGVWMDNAQTHKKEEK